jgi:peroxiredoxin
LQTGTLDPQQEAQIIRHFADLKGKHPAEAALFTTVQELVLTRTIGKLAPDIVGEDYDGVEFRLSDYRGKVVVLVFSGEWCGPCRGEYPYQKFLMDLYKEKPFTVLSVNSDSTLDVARKAKADHDLTYRSWWDGYLEKSQQGPIATAWGVVGWPTIYVLDARGVIRFVNLRQEDLLRGVRQLMEDLERRTAKK